MSTAVVFSIADKLRSFKDKAESIDLIAEQLSGALRERVAEWKDMDVEEIRASLKGKLLDDLKAKLPDKHQFLLRPVAALDDHLIDLGDWSKEEESTVPVPVKVTASASASIELDGVLDEDLAKVLKGPVPSGSTLFTVSINGKIGIDATAKAATPLVSLAVAASGSRAQTLVVGFLRDSDQPVLLELVRVRDYFVNPADLHEVMALFADKSARVIQHHYHGAHSLGLKIAVKKDLAAALRDLIPNPATTSSGSAEMSFEVRLKREDDFLLTIERDTASSAFVRLERKASREQSRVFKLGVSIEIKGLRGEINNVIGELLPDNPKVKAALGKLDELVEQLDGGGLRDLIGAELASRFDDHEELFGALLGNTDVNKVKDQLIEELTGTLTDRIDERVNVLGADASAAASAIAQDIATAVALDADTALELADLLAASSTSALESVKTQVTKKIESLAKTASGSEKLKAILGPLKDAGGAVKDALNNLGSSGAGALQKVKAGIETVYTKYTNFRQKLMELVNERVTEQAAFSFISERTERIDDTTLIAFRILDANAEGVAELYRAMWSRQLDKAWDLMKQAEADAGITDLSGSYVSVFKNQRRAIASLNLFGLEVSTEVMFSDEVAVGVDHTGTLIVAKNKAELQTLRRRGSESQTLTVEWSFDFLDPDPTLVPPIKISIDVSDDKFDKDDLRGFFDSLNKLECVKPDAFDAVGMQLLGGVNSAKRLDDVSLGLVVALTWNELGAILGANHDGTPRPDKWDGADVAAQLFAIIKRGHPLKSFFMDLERAAALENREPLGLLLEVGRMGGVEVKEKRPNLREYHAIGKSMLLLDRHLGLLQGKWPTLLAELGSVNDPKGVKRVREMIAEVDEELRAVFLALFLSNTFPLFPDLSKIWQATSGARLLLDRVDRDHLLLTIEGPKITRRIVG